MKLASAALTFFLVAGSAVDHGSAISYDIGKQVTLTGVVTEWIWKNPHVFILFDVTDDQGKVVNWAVEGGAPNALYRAGWKPTSLKAGDRVTIVGSRAKDGSNLANATSFTLADGRCLFAGSSGPNGDATTNCRQGGR